MFVFQACSATNLGGALAAESGSVIVDIFNTNFSACISSASGGAIAALPASVVRVSASFFLNNSAYGNGGGAIYSKFSSLRLDKLPECR
jgi:predicted outer membrane repeat protein